MNVLEQRQAEAVVSIAKTLRTPERGVKDAVMIADALIAELKKGGEE